MPQRFQCLIRIFIITAAESVRYVTSLARSRSVLAAENLFLRKQLAFYQERQARPRRLTDAARFSLALWSHLFNWKDALVIVKPETLVRGIARASNCSGGGSHAPVSVLIFQCFTSS